MPCHHALAEALRAYIDEDELTAIHLRNRLERRRGDKEAVRRAILAGGEVLRFYDPARPLTAQRISRSPSISRSLQFRHTSRLRGGMAGRPQRTTEASSP